MTRTRSSHRSQSPGLVAAALLFASMGSIGCLRRDLYQRPPCDRADLGGCPVDEVVVRGNKAVPASEIKEKIATAETNHSFGGGFVEKVPIVSLYDQLTLEYERFDRTILDRDLARVERTYRAKGYYEAHARVARVVKLPKGGVHIEIVVDEGDPVRVVRQTHEWDTDNHRAPKQLERLVDRAASHVKVGEVFDEDAFEEAKKRTKRALTDAGYAYATVKGDATVDPIKREAVVRYEISPGPRCKFGPILIEGIGDLPEKRLRAVLDLNEGDDYSTDKIEQAQINLGALGVLASIDATPKLDDKSRPTAVPVVFRGSPAPLRTVKFGGGAAAGTTIETHGVISWEHRNLFGGLRRFSIEARPALVYYPFSLGNFSTGANGFRVLPELRVHSEFRQPGFIEQKISGIVSSDVSVYRPLQGQADADIVGYFEVAGRTGIDRTFFSKHLSLGVSLNIQNDVPFSYKDIGKLPAGYASVTLPYADLIIKIDHRYGSSGKLDPINPHSGIYIAADFQSAWLDSQDFRIKPEVRGYIPLGRKWTLALRAAAGFLLPVGGVLADAHPEPKEGACQWSQTQVDERNGAIAPALGSQVPTVHKGDLLPRAKLQNPKLHCTEYSRYVQLLQLRGFFSGGPNSNRGYSYNEVGAHVAVPGVSTQYADKTFVPIATGGTALWEASAELRFPLPGKVGGVVFVDASDLTGSIADLNRPAPHISPGFGIRYQTPVGPLRLDVGFRPPGLQVWRYTRPVYDTTDPNAATSDKYLLPKYGAASTTFALPMAISLAIGESF